MSRQENDTRTLHVCISELTPYERHARKHDAGKLKVLARSIEQLGLIDPVIIDEGRVILSGHLRVEAYRRLGLNQIKAIQVFHLNDHQKRAYVIAANRFPERGGWDRDCLKLEIGALIEFAPELDIETTGFEVPEIDLMFATEDTTSPVASEEEIPEPPVEPISRPGDLWRLGEHLVYCGSCLEGASWRKLMGNERAQICFTDPPYNVRIKGHVTSKSHDEFDMAAGEMSSVEFEEFLAASLGNAVRFSSDGALHYIAMDHRHLRELYAACDPIYTDQLNLIVWNKTNAGMGSFYRSRHELIALYKVGHGTHTNNVQLGRFGRNRSNVWTYAGANTFRSGRDKDLADHPTVKPTKMIEDALLDASRPKDIVIDGFAGSGSTLLAAERTGRRARVIELDPRYVDVVLSRWSAMTGDKPVLLEDDQHPQPPLALAAPETEGAAS